MSHGAGDVQSSRPRARSHNAERERVSLVPGLLGRNHVGRKSGSSYPSTFPVCVRKFILTSQIRFSTRLPKPPSRKSMNDSARAPKPPKAPQKPVPYNDTAPPGGSAVLASRPPLRPTPFRKDPRPPLVHVTAREEAPLGPLRRTRHGVHPVAERQAAALEGGRLVSLDPLALLGGQGRLRRRLL